MSHAETNATDPRDDAAMARASAGNPAPPAPGTTFGRYRLIELLGAGGMGVVWRAWDPELGREVAIKQIRGGSRTPVAMERFRREAELAARLRHPGIVGVYDAGVCGETPFLALEFVRGRTLARILDERRKTRAAGFARPPEELRRDVELLADAAAAIGAAHRAGVIHRDLKPANLVIDGSGRPRVMDFGLAKEFQPAADAMPALTRDGQAIGTPHYMSPEQVAGDLARVGPASDVWSLGVTLYEALVGSVPFGGRETLAGLFSAILDGDYIPPRRLAPDVPEELAAVCGKALAPEPAERYRDAADLEADLRRWLQGDPVGATRPSRLGSALRRAARRPALALVVAAIVLASAGIPLWVDATRRGERAQARALLDQIQRQAEAFQATVMREPMPQEAREALSEQPLGALERLLERFPESGAARAWRGRYLELLGKHAEARREYDRACADAPDEAVTWYLRGMAALREYGRRRPLPGALATSTGIAFQPAGPEDEDARALRERGRVDLERAAAQPPTPEFGAEQRAAALGRAALVRADADAYLAALRAVEGRTGPEAEKVRGRAHYHRGEFAASVEAFDRALAAWPEDADARWERGMAQLCRGVEDRARGRDPRPRFRAALEDYRAALARDGGVGDPLNPGTACLFLAQEEAGRGGDARAHGQEAMDFLTLSIRRNPGTIDARLNRAMARELLADVEEDAGRDPRERLDAALGDARDAAALETGLGAADPLAASMEHARGAAEERRGGDGRAWFERATSVVEELLRAEPRDSRAIHLRGIIVRSQAFARGARGEDPAGELERARGIFTATVELAPDWSEPRENRARVTVELALHHAGRGEDPSRLLAEAEADLDEVLARHPTRGSARELRLQARLTAALQRARHGEDPRAALRRALEDPHEVLRIDPGSATARYGRAVVYRWLAEADARRGLDPRESLERARADLDAFLGSKPGDARARILRVLVLRYLAGLPSTPPADRSGFLEQALADLDGILAIDAENTEARHERATLQMNRAREPGHDESDRRAFRQAALADLDLLLNADPRDLKARLHRALVRLMAGISVGTPLDESRTCLDGTVEDCTAVTEIEPGLAIAWTRRGEAHAELGRRFSATGDDPAGEFAAAEADFRAGAERGDVEAWVHLGQLFRALGRTEEAIDAFETAARAIPPLASQLLGLVEELRREERKR